MDHSFVSVQPDRIFHGLSQIFVVPDKAKNLLSAKKPATTISIASSPVFSSFLQSTFLTGGAVATPATQTFTIGGVVTVGATVRFVFHGIPVNGTLADGPFHDVVCEFDIQSGNTLANIATAMAVVLNVASSGTGTPTNGRIYCLTDKTATKAQISTAMQLKYASTVATVSTVTITITGEATGGTDQNEFDISVEVLPKPPSITTLSTDQIITAARIKFFCATNSLVYNFSSTDATIDCDQSFLPIDTYSTGQQGQVTLNGLEDLNPDVLRTISQNTARASTNNYDVIIPSFFPNGQTYGMFVLTDSQAFPGQKDIAVFRQVRSTSIQLGRSKAHAPIAATFSLLAPGTEDICYLAEYRASITT